MKVLVTGHQGYIGSVLVPMLVRSKHEVTGLDAGFFENCHFLEPEILIPEIRKDTRDLDGGEFEGFDSVIHLAALSNDLIGNMNPELTYDINFRSTVRMAQMAKEAGVRRFLFSSSCSTYGAAGDDLLDEQAAFQPVTPYGESKVLAEYHLAELADENFCPVFLRNATAYGMSPRIRFDLVVNNLVAWAVATGKIYLKSDGSAWRPLVHVGDISKAFLALLEADEDLVRGKAYNVGITSENYRVRELAQMVSEIIPRCEVTYAEGASSDSRNYRVSFERIVREIPGFYPDWNVRKGIQEVYDAISTRMLEVADFEGSRYMRLAHLQERMACGELDEQLKWVHSRMAP